MRKGLPPYGYEMTRYMTSNTGWMTLTAVCLSCILTAWGSRESYTTQGPGCTQEEGESAEAVAGRLCNIKTDTKGCWWENAIGLFECLHGLAGNLNPYLEKSKKGTWFS